MQDTRAMPQTFGVIFDFDGVLADTAAFHRQAWFDLAQKEGFEITNELFYSTFGMQNYQIIPLLARQELPAAEIERLADWKEKRYRELADGRLAPAKGAKPLLEELKKSGWLLAVGSSAPRANLDFMLAQVRLRTYFDACVAGEDVKKGKPAPDTFLKAADKLALAPRRCVVVEDALTGVEAAKNAGMAVVALTTTRRRGELKQADLIVDCLDQLKPDDFANLVGTRTATDESQKG